MKFVYGVLHRIHIIIVRIELGKKNVLYMEIQEKITMVEIFAICEYCDMIHYEPSSKCLECGSKLKPLDDIDFIEERPKIVHRTYKDDSTTDYIYKDKDTIVKKTYEKDKDIRIIDEVLEFKDEHLEKIKVICAFSFVLFTIIIGIYFAVPFITDFIRNLPQSEPLPDTEIFENINYLIGIIFSIIPILIIIMLLGSLLNMFKKI